MVSITGPWGFILSGTDHQIDLKPRSQQKTNQSPLMVKEFLPLLLSAGVFLILLTAMLHIKTYENYLYLKALEKQFDPLQGKAASEKQKLQDIRKIQSLLQSHLPMADVLRDVYSSTPQGIVLTRLSYNSDSSFNIEGAASNQNTLNEFEQRLNSLVWFKNIALQKAVPKLYNDQKLLAFKLNGLITLPERKSTNE